MKRFKFEYVVEIEEAESDDPNAQALAYEIAKDSLGCFDVTELCAHSGCNCSELVAQDNDGNWCEEHKDGVS